MLAGAEAEAPGPKRSAWPAAHERSKRKISDSSLFGTYQIKLLMDQIKLCLDKIIMLSVHRRCWCIGPEAVSLARGPGAPFSVRKAREHIHSALVA